MAPAPESDGNLRRYQVIVGATSALFWLPTVILFFIDEFGLVAALQLQAIYYFSVVLAEVPSGWFSDRVGRVQTLRLVAVWWIGAFSAFLLADQFAVAALGQILLAIGYAFLSGTDVTFHYDSLEALGREDEFEHREAIIRRNGMIVRAASVIVGGGLGVISLRLPYAAALIAAIVLGVTTLGLRRPPGRLDSGGFGVDLLAAVRVFRNRLLGWILLYVIAQVVLEHLASEFSGPYLAEVLGEDLTDVDRAPLITGVLAAFVALVGAASVRRAPWLRQRLGLVGALTAVAMLPAVTVAAMALVTTGWVVVLLALRNVQSGIAGVLIPAAVGQRVPAYQRATVLSFMSLGGRLAYGGVLLSLSRVSGFTNTLEWAALVAVAAIIVVATSAGTTRGS